MASTYSIGGLMSGMDTDSIVSALVELKTQQLITPLEDRVLELSANQAALETVQTAVSSMRSAADSLNNTLNFEGRAGTSSDTDQIEMTSLSTSTSLGTYSVDIEQMAQADRNFFNGVADSDVTQFGTGTIQIQSSGRTINVVIDATNNTLAGIRDAINEYEGPVTASIVNDGGANPYRLILTSDETGDDSDIVQNISAILTLVDDAALNADASNVGQDAEVVINAMTVTSETNTISNAIEGLSFKLLSDAGSSVTLTISEDYTNTYTSVANFVNAYNEVVAKLKDQFAYDETTGQSTGTLAGDLTLQGIQYRLNTMMVGIQSQLAGNEYKSISQVGITMNDDGYLVIDEDKFYSKMGEDQESVRRLFQGMSDTVDGIADITSDYLYNLSNTADGILTEKNTIWQENIDDLLSQIDDRADRIDQYEETMRAKFTYMEQTLLGLNQQSNALEALNTSLDTLNAAINS